MAKHKTVAAEKPLDLALRPGQSIELLKELHILTRDGKLNQDSRRKLKQVYHLYQFIEKLLNDLQAKGYAQPELGPTLADHGAGKSYLGFIIYDLFFKGLGNGSIYGIETRSELVPKYDLPAPWSAKVGPCSLTGSSFSSFSMN